MPVKAYRRAGICDLGHTANTTWIMPVLPVLPVRVMRVGLVARPCTDCGGY